MAGFSRRALLLAGLASMTLPLGARAAVKPHLVVYKSPSCGCCHSWAEAMARGGFNVETHDTDDLSAIRHKAGLPDALSSCHTGFVGGYLIEGHVPPADVLRLLKDRPKVLGLTIPGMPASAPGMDSPGRRIPYDVLLVTRDGRTSLYAHHA